MPRVNLLLLGMKHSLAYPVELFKGLTLLTVRGLGHSTVGGTDFNTAVNCIAIENSELMRLILKEGLSKI